VGCGGWWGRRGGGGGGETGQGSDVVMEFLSDVPTPRRHPRISPATSNQIESPSGTDWLTCTRAAVENYLRHSQIHTTGRKLGLKSPPSAIPDLGVSHHITQTPLRFLRRTTCGIASQPTCPGSALDRSVLRDFKATQQETLASNNLKGKRRTISNTSRPNPILVRAKCAF
jgi:hypothetical protein